MTPNLPTLGQTPDDQLFDPTRSWVVTAGAGTGKTWRLVRRYVRCLQHLDTEGLSASHMLAVTFTRAAAAEMRGRVLRALLGREAADPAQDEVLAGVQSLPAEKRERLAADVADAPIETLHSFCARLLSSLPELSGVAPGVRPIEPSQDALRRDAFVRRFVDDVLEGHRAELQVDASEVLREYSLVEFRKMLSACIMAADMPPAELTDAQAVAAARWKLYGPQLEEWGQRLRTAFETACLQLEQVAGPKAQSRLGDLSQLRDALREGNWNAAFCMKKPGRNADVRKVETEAGPAFDAAWKVMVERSKFRGNATLVKVDTDAEHIHCERLARTMRLGLAARRAYEDHLATEGLMRFDDLEHRAVELLQRPEARAWLVGRYRHLLVDEFQDTSPLQLKLVQALREVCAGDGSPVSVFEVGDVKQSIYRFRGAEVAMFEGELRRAPANQRGHLSMTRRTEPALAAFFNQVFPRLLQGVPGEDPDRAEVPWGEGDVIQTSKNASTLPGKPVTLLLSLPVEPMSEEDDVERPETQAGGESSADEDEDEALADGDPGEPSRIAAWLSLWFKQADKIRYSDVAILLPKWDSAEPIRAALEVYGIPAQVSGGRGLKRLPAVRDLINLLAFLCDPADNVAAAGVLRGPAAGISDLGLYALTRWPCVRFTWDDKAKSTGGPAGGREPAVGPSKYTRSLHMVARGGVLDPVVAVDALIAGGAATQDQREGLLRQLGADAAALAQLVPVLAELFDRAGSEPTAELLVEAMHRLQLPLVWTAEPDPKRAVANAWRLVELVRALEPNGPDLAGLLAWLAGEDDPTPEGLIESGTDAVTITTCHGAKGLEWRLVILAGLHEGLQEGDRSLLKLAPIAPWKDPSRADAASSPTRDLVAPRLKVPAGGLRYDKDPLHDLCRTLNSGLVAAEVKRLLYVAITRAAERVVLSGKFDQKKVLLSDEDLEARKKAGDPVDGRWRTMEDCSRTSQYLTSVLRLTPDEGGRRWTLGTSENSPDFSGWVDVVDQVALAKASLTRTAGSDTLPPLPTLPPQVPTPAPVEREHAKPSELRSSQWRGAVLSDVAATLKIAIPPRPARLEKDEEWENQLGNVLHNTMELWGMVPSQRPDTGALRRLALALLPTDGEALDLDWLLKCMDMLEQSELGREMAAAAARGELWHELPFNLHLPADATSTRPELALSGRVDALFRDAEGRWVVVDYKLTKKGATGTMAELQASYGKQLLAYRAALQECGLDPVSRAGLWLAASGVAVWLASGPGATEDS